MGKKVATVVSEPVQIGLMNMAAVFTEQHGMRMGVFKSLDEARAWLLHEDEEEQTSG